MFFKLYILVVAITMCYSQTCNPTSISQGKCPTCTKDQWINGYCTNEGCPMPDGQCIKSNDKRCFSASSLLPAYSYGCGVYGSDGKPTNWGVCGAPPCVAGYTCVDLVRNSQCQPVKSG